MSAVTRRQNVRGPAANQKTRQRTSTNQSARQRSSANQSYEQSSTSGKEVPSPEEIQTAKSEEVKGHPVSKDGVESCEPALPIIEVMFYAVCIIGIMFKANILSVYSKSNDHVADFGDYNLVPGWRILGGRKLDISDFEWNYAKNTHFSLPFLAAIFWYVVVGKITDAYSPELRVHARLLFSLVCMTAFVGLPVLLMYFLHTIVTFVASRTRSNIIVWAVMLFQIGTLNFEPFTSYQRAIFKVETDYYNVIFGVAMCQLRLLSFAIDYCQNSNKKDEDGKPDSRRWSFYDVLVYNFYLPLFIGGPVFTYDQFKNQYYQAPKPFNKEEFKRIMKEFIRYIFWFLLMEVALHYLYFPAFQQRKYLLMFLPNWAIGGIALNHLIFFQVKYVILYGLPRVIGLFDGLDVPRPPICVIGTYLYQDFWRYFDRGLHRLLVTCIYIPLGGSKRGLIMQLFASMLCFAFVYYWHGSDTHLLYWAMFNWIGVTFEQLTQMAVDKFGMGRYMRNKLSGAMYRRLVAMLRTPVYICLAASNLVFLAGTNIAHIYFDRLILSGWPYATMTTVFLMYCFIQVTKEFHRVYGKRNLCQKDYGVF